MIDHFTLTVTDLEKSREFYIKALRPLGYGLVRDYKTFLGFGDKRPYFWLKGGTPGSHPMHIAFAAKDRDAVDGFYAAALEAGGRDDGPPGIRKQYHPNYYGAFVLDPSGHPIEAVCHAPQDSIPAKVKKAPVKKKATKRVRAA